MDNCLCCLVYHVPNALVDAILNVSVTPSSLVSHVLKIAHKLEAYASSENVVFRCNVGVCSFVNLSPKLLL